MDTVDPIAVAFLVAFVYWSGCIPRRALRCPECMQGRLRTHRYPQQLNGKMVSLATCPACGIHFRYEAAGPRPVAAAAITAGESDPG